MRSARGIGLAVLAAFPSVGRAAAQESINAPIADFLSVGSAILGIDPGFSAAITQESIDVPGNNVVIVRIRMRSTLISDGSIGLSGNEPGYICTDPEGGIPGKYGKRSKTPLSSATVGTLIFKRAGSRSWSAFRQGMELEPGTYTFRVNDSDLENNGSYTLTIEPVEVYEPPPQPREAPAPVPQPTPTPTPPSQPTPPPGIDPGDGPLALVSLRSVDNRSPIAPETRDLRRPFIGAQFPKDRSLRVTTVVRDSPADAAGLAVGDVITRVDDVSLRSFDDLVRERERRHVGDVMTLHVHRPLGDVLVKVRLGTEPAWAAATRR